MKYEILVLDGLYCIFKDGRIICATETLKDAKERVKLYKSERKEQLWVKQVQK